jgi:hypothetical protein
MRMKLKTPPARKKRLRKAKKRALIVLVENEVKKAIFCE